MGEVGERKNPAFLSRSPAGRNAVWSQQRAGRCVPGMQLGAKKHALHDALPFHQDQPLPSPGRYSGMQRRVGIKGAAARRSVLHLPSPSG
jgi:hypothetical protein